MSIYAVANMLKVQLRGEPIIPADLSFLSGGDTGNIVSFIPKDSETFISSAVTTLLWFLVVCFICFVLDGRRKFIYCSWTHPFASIKNILGNLTRIIAAVLSVAIFFSFTWNLGTPNSWPYKWIRDMGYKAELWNPTDDAQANGPAISFLNLTHVKAMDEPNGYSKEAMQKLAQRYSKEAALINKNRANNLTDNNVVMILSESFSDPTRVPGIAYDIDPMPHIRSLKNTTTSGLMLSPGYGAVPPILSTKPTYRPESCQLQQLFDSSLSATCPNTEKPLFVQSNLERKVWLEWIHSCSSVLQQHVPKKCEL